MHLNKLGPRLHDSVFALAARLHHQSPKNEWTHSRACFQVLSCKQTVKTVLHFHRKRRVMLLPERDLCSQVDGVKKMHDID